MVHWLEDESLGLKLQGYSIVPNSALETKIAVYTPDVVQSILAEHPEIVDRWLQGLHSEYIHKKKSCDFESDPVACFSLSVYEEFEKHFKSWHDGGFIAISLPGNSVIRVSKRPLFSVVRTPAAVSVATTAPTNTYFCDSCLLTLGSLQELVRHYRVRHPEMIEKVTLPI